MIVFLASCGDSDTELPRLINLKVSAGSESLYPAFDQETSHYAIRCDASTVLDVSAQAASEWHAIKLNGAFEALGSAESQYRVPGDDEDLVIEVTYGGRSELYTVHCIPRDVPDIEVLVSSPGASQDLLFLSPQIRRDGSRTTYLLILDNNGVPRFQRRLNGRAVDFKRHWNGLYSYAQGIGRNDFGLNDSVIVILDQDFNEIERLTTVDLTHTDNHDFLITREGTHIFLSYNSVVRDMSEFGLSTDQIMGDSVIQEVDEDGNVILEWSSWDHIDLLDCQDTGYPRFPNDYAHINAVSLTPSGDLIASFRGCAQVLKIDRTSGDVLWYLGGSRSSFNITGDPFAEFCGQHTAWELNNGNVLLFDNGNYCLGAREELFGSFSRAVEYQLDHETGEARFVRDYSLFESYLEFTRSQGSVQPQANGNWLIGWGNGPGMSATEVTPEGEKVFELKLSADGATTVSYRALRFPDYSADK